MLGESSILSHIKSSTIVGIDAQEILVEIDAAQGLPNVNIVGLPDKVINESKSRIRSAIRNSGFQFPIKSYTINLAPADLPKEGPLFDLAIAVGILKSTQQIHVDKDYYFVGELSLDGSIKKVRSILCICDFIRKKPNHTLILPKENEEEACYLPGLNYIPISHLSDLKALPHPNIVTETSGIFTHVRPNDLDLQDVKGQFLGKRALEIAAAGKHNILLVGPPGSGKTMLIKRLPTILPALSFEQAITVQKIQSRSVQIKPKPLSSTPSFRSPHHSISFAGMVGGGNPPRPGEISLAHNGILFLDEFPEFQRHVIEVLRQPMEDKEILLSRAALSLTYPANFQLAATMNPCPCGYFADSSNKCECSPQALQKYWKKLSGPILDRIDIIVEIPRLHKKDFSTLPSETSQHVRERVQKAVQLQTIRYNSPIRNGEASTKHLESQVILAPDLVDFLATGVEKGLLTARSYDKTIRVARTIADLAGDETIQKTHLLEALQLRKTIMSPGSQL